MLEQLGQSLIRSVCRAHSNLHPVNLLNDLPKDLPSFKLHVAFQDRAKDTDTMNQTSSSDPPTYQPKDAIGEAVHALAITGGAGALIAAVQNTLQKQNVGAIGVLSRFGGTFAVFSKYTYRETQFPNGF